MSDGEHAHEWGERLPEYSTPDFRRYRCACGWWGYLAFPFRSQVRPYKTAKTEDELRPRPDITVRSRRLGNRPDSYEVVDGSMYDQARYKQDR